MFRLSRQDWSRLQRFTGWQNVVIVEDSSMYILIVETFFYWFAPRSKSAFALQVFSKKNIVKERTTNRKRNVYIQKRGWAAKQREERDGSGKGWKKACDALIFCLIRVDRRGWKWSKETCESTIALFLLALFTVFAVLFTFPVPRSPFFELHAPNPTSDPHKGRRGRDTFGKSSATPLQRIRRVSQKSLVPRYVCFSDSLGSGAQAEWETDSSRVWSITRDDCVDRLEK